MIILWSNFKEINALYVLIRHLHIRAVCTKTPIYFHVYKAVTKGRPTLDLTDHFINRNVNFLTLKGHHTTHDNFMEIHWLKRLLVVITIHHICLILQNDPSTVSTSHTVQHMSKYQKITNCQNPTQKMVRLQPKENSPPVLHHEHQDQPSAVA